MAELKQEETVQTAVLLALSLVIALCCLFILIVSMRHSWSSFNAHKEEQTSRTRLAILILTPLAVFFFTTFNVILVHVYASVLTYGTCKVYYNRMSLRGGVTAYSMGKYCTYVMYGNVS